MVAPVSVGLKIASNRRKTLLSTTLKLCTYSCAIILFTACAQQPQQHLWEINSLEQLNGLPVAAEGNPQLIDTPYGQAVRFDGEGDRLLIDANPLGEATEFTVEIIFRPNDAFPNNWEPRFFHIEAPDNPNRRITIELRLNDRQQWYLDTYIKSEMSQHTLIDETLVHPVGEWAHAAITYKDRQFTAYVNGEKELSAEVDYLPIAANGQTSIGARMNRVHWFNGDILAVGISHEALAPEEFLLMKRYEL